MQIDRAEEIIPEVIRERMPSVTVHKVVVKEDEDSDGDLVLRVAVILEGRQSDFDGDRFSGIVRHIGGRLLQEKNDAFPILSFVSKSDAKKLSLAT